LGLVRAESYEAAYASILTMLTELETGR